MKNKKTIFFTLILSLTASLFYAREDRVLSDGWSFAKLSVNSDKTTKTLEPITIPHTWNIDLINGDSYYLGKGKYINSLTINEIDKKRYFLKFEGALTVATLYVNEKFVDKHEGGYSAFCFEITKFLKKGDNIIKVIVDNSYNNDITPISNSLFTRFGGIYRPVHLIKTQECNISPLDYASSGVYISPLKVSNESAEIEIKTVLSGDKNSNSKWSLKTTIKDRENSIILSNLNDNILKSNEIIKTFTIENPHLWDGKKDPYLYCVKIDLIKDGKSIDTISQPLGLRNFYVDREKGFFLNGKHLDLYGVNRHQEWEKEASALTDAHHKADIEMIMEIGANGVRFAHYQQSKTIYSLCDQEGLVIWAEIPVTPPYQTKNQKFKDNCKQQLTELIRQNYNHPSIFFWGMYNEVHIKTKDVMSLHNLAKKEDPYRLTTAASNKPLSKRHTITDLICWNQYPYWYGGEDISKWHNKILKRRKKIKVGVSEYGAGGCYNQHQIPPERPNPATGKFFPEEYMSQIHEKIWADIKGEDAIWGKFIWNMFDFSWPTVNRGYREFMNNKGLVTYDRKIKKDPFFFYKANWRDDTPVLHITSKRFINRKESETPIIVYTNCSEVDIYHNNKKIATVETDDISRVILEHMTLVKGENRIRVEALFGDEKISDKVIWILE